MEYQFRKAELKDIAAIWDILQQAIIRRKEDGSDQWQDGYPNPVVVQKDIEGATGYVLTWEDTIIGYCAVLANDEPAYENIEGEWLTTVGFVAVHRVAISQNYLGKGLAQKILECVEHVAKSNDIYSIKADTNFDNLAMIRIFEKLGYVYCGEVFFRGSPRKAYEKILVKGVAD